MRLLTTLLGVLGLASSYSSALDSIARREVSNSSTSTYWYANVQHNGISPTITDGENWVVFRNVKAFGAKGDGVTDDSIAIQNAINQGNAAGDRVSGVFGMTQQPAVVFFPPGTYVVSRPVLNLADTVLMGDPTSRPTIKAARTFNDTTLIVGRDARIGGLGAFQFEIKNFVLDSSAVPSVTKFNLISWDVSQACQLSNILFSMPIGSSHTGIIAPTAASPLILNDLQFVGGNLGFNATTTQYHFKNLDFRNIKTGLKLAQINSANGQGLRFENVSVGVDATGGGSGFFSLIDSSATNTPVLVALDEQQFTLGSLVLENVIVDSTVETTVAIGGTPALQGSVEPGSTWIRGHVYNSGSSSTTAPENFAKGQMVTTSRPSALVNSTGSYFTATPPTYAEYDVSQVVNVKSVPGLPVVGDAKTDDTANIQSILNTAAANNQLVFFPHGIYLLTDTLTIPPGSRLVGEAWSELSASGPKFKDAANPRPVVQVGAPGSTGVAQFTDFMFTSAEILPGAVLVEVNMAGTTPGDVGFFNSHFRIAGAAGSTVQDNCADPLTCAAVRLLVHVTTSSSSYWENNWLWGADHSLDNSNATQSPAAAGGLLVESQRGTWFLGLGVEHHALYGTTLFNARNVFIGLQQGESPYWQGNGTVAPAPQPWSDTLTASDPDFAWCAADADQCRMSLYQRVINSSDVNIYASGFWNFVEGPQRTFCTVDCQDNAAQFTGNSRFYSYGLSTINQVNAIIEGGVAGSTVQQVALKSANAANAGGPQSIGSVGAVVAAFLRQSGDANLTMQEGMGNTSAATQSSVPLAVTVFLFLMALFLTS